MLRTPATKTSSPPEPARPPPARKPPAPVTNIAALQDRVGVATVQQLVAGAPLGSAPRLTIVTPAPKPGAGGSAASVTKGRPTGAASPSAPRSTPASARATEEPATAAEAPSLPARGKSVAGAGTGSPTESSPSNADPAAVAAAPAVTVELKMPPPPAGLSAGTKKRIGGVGARAGGKAAAQGALPPAAAQVGDARQAVTPPDAERAAAARAALIAQVNAAPSPEIVKLCERIREVIRNKRPPDEDALVAAKPEGEAMDAGNQLNETVQGETQKVQGNYAAVGTNPATPGASPAPGVPPQPAAAPTPPINAKAAVPDAVPAEKVSLTADAEAAKKQQVDAGMESPAAQEVKTGPIAEARDAQGELDKAAAEDPAKVMAKQQAALGKAENDMAALQMQALAALTSSRDGAVKGTAARQTAMVGTEDQMRTNAGLEAKKAFDDAQALVTAQLKDLPGTARAEWDAAKTVLVANFKSDLAIVKKNVDERHSGASGFVVGLWDAVTGLPDWATEAYDKAELRFADGVIEKLTKISTDVNAVIAACDLIIKGAREKIAGIFAALPASLQGWAAQEQGKFEAQLDKLHDQVIATRDTFNKELVDDASAAVDEVRAEIAELRAKAGGLVGRIAAAVQKFLDDPVKFIIEGLLTILGIPPAAFWAVIAKIKQVAKDIADDPMNFGNNLLKGLGQGFSLFFDNFAEHMVRGFLTWLLGDLKGVQVPKDLSLRSIVTFFLQLMGITWPNIRKILVDKIGAKNVALIEKVYSLVSLLMEKGPEGIYEMIKEKLDPQSIVDQVVDMAVDYMVTAVAKAVGVRILLLFNPAGAIVQALEAIYKVLKWVFQNAAKIFTLVETVVNGMADIIAGNVGGFAKAVEKGLAMLMPPVLAFLADYLGFGDLPQAVAKQIKAMQKWILGIIEKAIVWLIDKGKALLAALGIGKKEKKEDKKASEEDVGEKIPFSAGSETHHVWIEGQGPALRVVVASQKEGVLEMLKRLEKGASPDALDKIKLARSLIDPTMAVARQEEQAIKAVTTAPEAEKSASDVAKLEAETVDAETQLAIALTDVLEACGAGGPIVKMIGKLVATRVPDGEDLLDGDFKNPGVPSGYSAYQVAIKSQPGRKKFYVKRLEKPKNEEDRPQVHIDEIGILQLGSSRYSADDDEKIGVYVGLLKAAGLPPLQGIEDADDYRRESRTQIVAKLTTAPTILNFMRDSKAVTPAVYNRLRGDIYDEAVSQLPDSQYARTNPTFLALRYPLLKHDRHADGENGDSLFESKGHQGSGPGAHDKDQIVAYENIILRKYATGEEPGGKTYSLVTYVIQDHDAREKWLPILTKSFVKIVP